MYWRACVIALFVYVCNYIGSMADQNVSPNSPQEAWAVRAVLSWWTHLDGSQWTRRIPKGRTRRFTWHFASSREDVRPAFIGKAVGIVWWHPGRFVFIVICVWYIRLCCQNRHLPASLQHHAFNFELNCFQSVIINFVTSTCSFGRPETIRESHYEDRTVYFHSTTKSIIVHIVMKVQIWSSIFAFVLSSCISIQQPNP